MRFQQWLIIQTFKVNVLCFCHSCPIRNNFVQHTLYEVIRKNHPFGHGKIESLSASVEGILIVIAGLVIIYEAVKRFFTPADIQQLDIGIIIVAIAGIINYILGYYSIRTGKKHGSIALIAGGKHLQSDTYSTIGLVIGLIVLYFTKMAWLDSVIAIIFGLVIIITGFKILKETTANLMDEADFEVLENITNILWDKKHETWIDLHNLKLVKYGNELHIDCDLTMPWYFDIRVAHKESDVIKELILKHYNDRISYNFV